MTIYKRPDNTIFAESAQSGEVVAFENMPRGWGVTLDSTKGIPPMEWFNFLQNRTDKAIQYILQNGITEYDTNLEYPQNAVVKSGGKLYLCLRQNTNKPLSNGAYWELLIKNATTSQGGIVQLSNAVDSTDETKASTPKATKTAHDKAIQADNNANARVKIDGTSLMTGSLSIKNNNGYSGVNLIAPSGVSTLLEQSPIYENSNIMGYFVCRDRNFKVLGQIQIPMKNGVILTTADKSNDTNLNDENKIATSRAVKNVNDNANSRLSKNGGTVGNIAVMSSNNYPSVVFKSSNDQTMMIELSPGGGGYVVLRKGGQNMAYYGFKTGNFGDVIVSSSNRLVPAGVITAYAGEDVPAGWLRMDNGYYDPATYPDLFKVLGYYYGKQGNKFLVPSIENRFIRGMANGLKRGQKQEDAIRNITGRVGPIDAGAVCEGAFVRDGNAGYGATANQPRPIIKFDASQVVPTADENRPKAIAFPYIIKY